MFQYALFSLPLLSRGPGRVGRSEASKVASSKTLLLQPISGCHAVPCPTDRCIQQSGCSRTKIQKVLVLLDPSGQWTDYRIGACDWLCCSLSPKRETLFAYAYKYISAYGSWDICCPHSCEKCHFLPSFYGKPCSKGCPHMDSFFVYFGLRSI